MACCLFSTKPLSKPVLANCQLESWEHISMKFESEFYHFHSRKCNWKFNLPKWRPFCPGGDALIALPLVKGKAGGFYASAFRRRRHYVFGLSVCPSVQSLKYPLLTCTWVCWSTRPTVTILRHVRPSVRLERFPGICRWTHGGNGLKFYLLMYLAHIQKWLLYGHGLLIFLILALFWLSETGQIGVFQAFPGELMVELAWNFARWCILTTFRTG